MKESAILLNCQNLARACSDKTARQTAGARADFQNVHPVDRPCGRGTILAARFQIQNEILAERFPRAELVLRDDRTKRREIIHPAQFTPPLAFAIRPAVRRALIKLCGFAMLRPAMFNAVPCAGETRMIGSPSVMLTEPWKSSVFTGISA